VVGQSTRHFFFSSGSREALLSRSQVEHVIPASTVINNSSGAVGSGQYCYQKVSFVRCRWGARALQPTSSTPACGPLRTRSSTNSRSSRTRPHLRSLAVVLRSALLSGSPLEPLVHVVLLSCPFELLVHVALLSGSPLEHMSPAALLSSPLEPLVPASCCREVQ
jgi:hypothetical protein